MAGEGMLSAVTGEVVATATAAPAQPYVRPFLRFRRGGVTASIYEQVAEV